MKYLTRFQLTNWTSTVCYVGENLRFERISRTMILFEKKKAATFNFLLINDSFN